MLALPGRRTSLLLELDLSEPLAEPGDDPLARLATRAQRPLRPTLRALHEAGADPRVAGVVAKIGSGLTWAATDELRRAVQAFTASGKPAVAWAESLGEGAANLGPLVLAAAFDEVWLQPSGTVGPLGVGIETTFLRGALDKLGVEPEFEQRHEYKNAVDRLTRTEFTAPHRESLEALAGSVFDVAVEALAADRRLAPERVAELADRGPLLATEALEAGLVDRLGYRDEVYAAIRHRLGDHLELLFADRWRPPRRVRLPARRRGHVALVPVRGTITTGRSRGGPMGRQSGSKTVSAALRAVLADDGAKAVVLQVDSPGGSAVGSDTIWREVVRVRESGRPVVVAMGGLAASGGYYVACPADVIVALPTTLTGSIGVFGGKFVAAELLERMGLTTGTVHRGARALMYSTRRAFDDAERARLAATVDAVYDDFVAKVAAGRRRPRDEIEAVARGRVWSGRDAVDVGLVDELGGLRHAVELARRRAGLADDAPVLPAVHVPAVARLTRPVNSEDPRAAAAGRTPAASLSAGLAALDDHTLRMALLRLR